MYRILMLLLYSIFCNAGMILAENWLRGENGLYYRINDNLLTWSDAIHECVQKSGRLINIIDEKAKRSAEKIIQGRERQQYWIGLSEDLFHRWIWSKGNALGYSNWEKREPREMSEQLQCASMNSEGKWESQDCDVKRKSICQRHFADIEGDEPAKSLKKKQPINREKKNKVTMKTENKTIPNNRSSINRTAIYNKNETKTENSTRKSLISNSSNSENEENHLIQTEYEKLAPPTENKKFMKQEIALMNQVLSDFRKGSEYKDEPTKKNNIRKTAAPSHNTGDQASKTNIESTKRSMKTTETSIPTKQTDKEGVSTTKNVIPLRFRPRSSTDTGLLFFPRHRNPTVKTIIVPIVSRKSQHTSLREALKSLDPETPLQRDVTSLRSVSVEGSHDACVFPFVYTSISYFDCIPSETRKDKTWCATTNNFDRDLKWGYCDERSAIMKNKSVANDNTLVLPNEDSATNNNLQNKTLTENKASNETHSKENIQVENMELKSKTNKTSNQHILQGNGAMPDKIHNNTIVLKENKKSSAKETRNSTANSPDYAATLSSNDEMNGKCPACVNNMTSSACENCKQCEKCKSNGNSQCDSCEALDVMTSKNNDDMTSKNNVNSTSTDVNDGSVESHASLQSMSSESNKDSTSDSNENTKQESVDVANASQEPTTEVNDVNNDMHDPEKSNVKNDQGSKDIDDFLGQVLEQQGLTKQEESQVIGYNNNQDAAKKPETPGPTGSNTSNVKLQSLEDVEKTILNVDDGLMQEQQKIQTSLNNTKNLNEHLREKDSENMQLEKAGPVDNLITTHDQQTENDKKLITAADVEKSENLDQRNPINTNNTTTEITTDNNSTINNATVGRQNITDQNTADEFDHLQPEGIKLLYKTPDPLKNSDLKDNNDKWHFLNVDNFEGLSSYLNTTRHMNPHVVAGLVIPIMTDIPLSHNTTEEPSLKRQPNVNKSEQLKSGLHNRGYKHESEKQEQAQNKGDIILTYGGNSNNEPCQFPFIYDGDSHFECITNEKRKAWCGTTENYDKTPLWGFCCFDEDCIKKSKTVKQNRKPKPKPEIVHYHSPASIQYPEPKHLKRIISKAAPKRSPKKKTTQKAGTSRQHGSKQLNKVNKAKKEGKTSANMNVNKTNTSNDKATPTNTYENYITPNYAPSYMQMPKYTGASIYPNTNMDINAFIHNGVKTYGGNSEGANCIIPFVYGGRPHHTCISRDDMTSWCATTNNFDKDFKWGNCCDEQKCAVVW